MSDYLWDRTGPADPEIERLERTLAPLRYQAAKQTPRRRWWPVAAAAAVVLATAGVWRFTPPASQATAWQISNVEGSVRLGSQVAAPNMPLRTGQVLETGPRSQITLEDDHTGAIDLGPDSSMSATNGRQLLLNRGQLHAYIWAPPRAFVVETASARAIDLGCEYTITVDESGDGLIRVATGWVAFQHDNLDSFIPAGAQCSTRQHRGPGIPYYADASPSFRDSLDAFERGDSAALTTVLDSARPRDGLTIWHLLTRVADGQRAAVYDRFTQLVHLPHSVTREGILGKDPHMLEQCWDALKLENTEWWRTWERKWK